MIAYSLTVSITQDDVLEATKPKKTTKLEDFDDIPFIPVAEELFHRHPSIDNRSTRVYY